MKVVPMHPAIPRCLAAGWLALSAVAAWAAEPPPAGFEPTEHYARRSIEGWRVLVNQKFLDAQPEIARRTLRLLRFQLFQIDRKVPHEAVNKLRKITIWVEQAEPHHPCMAYHPDAGWLREHGMNPDKARCVEVANAENFWNWTRQQPWMVLHELAHGYHDQFLGGFDNAEIRRAYASAMKAGLYRSVLHVDGKNAEKAYAATNPMEYFAEGTEAYFGTNDFYPFVRAELRQYDPAMHDLLEKLWGVRQAPASK